jgi:hypothetical protein
MTFSAAIPTSALGSSQLLPGVHAPITTDLIASRARRNRSLAQLPLGSALSYPVDIPPEE